jgi:hypothetical protein
MESHTRIKNNLKSIIVLIFVLIAITGCKGVITKENFLARIKDELANTKNYIADVEIIIGSIDQPPQPITITFEIPNSYRIEGGEGSRLIIHNGTKTWLINRDIPDVSIKESAPFDNNWIFPHYVMVQLTNQGNLKLREDAAEEQLVAEYIGRIFNGKQGLIKCFISTKTGLPTVVEHYNGNGLFVWGGKFLDIRRNVEISRAMFDGDLLSK